MASSAAAEVVRVEIRRRDDLGRYERLIGRVFFAIDPSNAANLAIADLREAAADAQGRIEFSSDVMIIRPKSDDRAIGTVFLEIVNRGRDQSLGLMNGAGASDAAPEHWDLGDRFALEQGFAVAFVGWQFDITPAQGLGLQAPVAHVRGPVRAAYVEDGRNAGRPIAFGAEYCATGSAQPDASLTYRARLDAPVETIPRTDWQFGKDGCSVQVRGGRRVGVYEAVYTASDSPIAGVGMAAVRDFASYLKFGGASTVLRERPGLTQRVIGFGYSQSGRFLREFVRDGFNRDEQGRQAFDALFIASAGAGGGSFNHRFAMPGQAGNSVLSILRPVDLPPFTDDALLARARAQGTVPRIFYTFSSTEYWARAGSLTHTTEDGRRDEPLAATSRLYFLAGTPHAGGPLPPARGALYRDDVNFAEQRWAMRALLIDLDAWIRSGVEPPPSRFPTIAAGQLVRREEVAFPRVAALPFPAYMPHVWRMDYGPEFGTARIITHEPPVLGSPYVILVPQVDADGNDVGGIQLPEVAVPLGTHTGWNMTVLPLDNVEYLAGLIGSFTPFARARADRVRAGDPRPSIAERYRGRSDYLARVTRAARALVTERFVMSADLPAILERAKAMWAAIVDKE